MSNSQQHQSKTLFTQLLSSPGKTYTVYLATRQYGYGNEFFHYRHGVFQECTGVG